VVTPFDIESIFPDRADTPDGSVRLPRRQTGSSPQDLVVTLMADYTLRTRAWVPSAAIVALLGDANVSRAGARTAISRLARRDVLEGSRDGRHSSYRLTRPAVRHLSAGGRWIAASTVDVARWDGWWTLVAFSLPKEMSVERRALRGQLRWLGYAPFYDGLWISPHEMTAKAAARLARYEFAAITVLRARHSERGLAANRHPIDAWDIAGIAREYECFSERWRPLLERVRRGAVGGAEAVHARTEVMDTFRRFPILDPRLPIELLPAPWPRPVVRDLFVEVYDGLAEAAQAHVRTVAERLSHDPQPGIRPHTIAELVTGVGLDGATAAQPVPTPARPE
jgi:phenylacetic acid degradation operon negative regulatory protein